MREIDILDEAGTLLEEMRRHRRHLHMYPELSFQEHETTKYIEAALEEIGLSAVRRTATGLWADIDGAGPGRTVLVRADIDALPIAERNEFAFRSTREGVMHACGHDGHTSILLGVARLLMERRTDMSGRVRLLFQPAEETLPGGAIDMIEAGVLEGVDAAIGLHLWAEIPSGPLPLGRATICAGPMMATADNFTVRVHGRGGHGALPHRSVDALTCAAQTVVALQQVVSRATDPMRSAVVTCGTLTAGTNSNIIAQEAVITGTVRTFDTETRASVRAALERIVRHTAEAFSATADFEYVDGYPTLVNDLAVTELFMDVVRDLLGEDAMIPGEAMMAGEDFAYYLRRVPGAYLFLGAGNPEVGAEFANHHPNFTIDEAALPLGAAVLATAAMRLLRMDFGAAG